MQYNTYFILARDRFGMKQILWFVKTYATWVVIFMLQKPLFLIMEKGSAQQPVDNVFTEMPSVIWHGLPLDLSLAGYLTVIPGLLLILSYWIRQELVRPILNSIFIITSFIAACGFVLNIGLYPYWGYPLDSTPLFYFSTSPSDALASIGFWQLILALLAVAVLTTLMWLVLRIPAGGSTRRYQSRYSNYGFGEFGGGRRTSYSAEFRHRGRNSFVLLLLTALLFLPIRGGVTVSTNNTGKVYFSQNLFLNHAAVNPLFSLFESLMHEEDFASQYRYLDDKEANEIFGQMISDSDQNTYPLLNAQTFKKGSPDILIVIMESFASDLLPSIGTQKDVAVCLDSIAQQGILFTRFYANSFRTDRGIVSILSGYPAQPTMSIMRYPHKTAQLPSIAKSLEKYRHYQAHYYYGGDADFCNMRSYLVSQGYQKIVADKDFPLEDKLSKWGVPDHIVANKLMEDIKKEQDVKQPMLRIFQTSSSHEPFDVPYSRLKDKRLNAFAYTDSVMGAIVKEYSKLPRWKNTLVVFVPDHVGGYKEHLDIGDRSRYQIPLILAGGAISRPMQVNIIGTQQDIAATLLAQLGVPHKDFKFSKNMLSDATPKFAFFTNNDLFGVVSEENSFIYDNKGKKELYDKGKKGYNKKRGMAYLQKLYDDIAQK